jgi:hypothetical protein
MIFMARCQPPTFSYGASRLRMAVMTWSLVQPPAAKQATWSCPAPSGSIERYSAIRSISFIFASWWIRPGCQAGASMLITARTSARLTSVTAAYIVCSCPSGPPSNGGP